MSDNNTNIEELQKGGELAERFCMFPRRYENNTAILRLKIKNKWGGWKLKDELVECIGLEVGKTISTTVALQHTCGLSTDADNIDLFASGESADWLIDNKVTKGTIIDCKVRFSYNKIPIGSNHKDIFVACLIFEEGLAVVETDDSDTDTEGTSDNIPFINFLQNLPGIDELI